jgi:glutamate-1-semialdehyde 2,1-aminomutase
MVNLQLAFDKEELLEQAQRVAPGGVNTSQRRIQPAMAPVHASGAYFTDADGKRYLDYHAAFGPIVLGHCHPDVNERVAETIRTLDLTGIGISPLEIELGEKLVQLVPSVERVLLCNSGSEGTYHALRLARGVTGRRKIIKFQGCYHGFHDAVCMNVISKPEKLGSCDPLSAGSMTEVLEQTIVCEYNNLGDVEDAVRRNRGDVAALILEPAPHNIGCVLPEPGFLEGLREITAREGIVLIFDEVITGFRHGLGGFQNVCGVTPDLTVMAKAIANGFPIAAVGGSASLMDSFDTRADGKVFFAGTYNGHALGCAAALATIEVLQRPGSYAHLYGLGSRVRSGLTSICERYGVRATVAGFGSVFVTYFMEGPVRSYRDLLRNDAHRFVDYRMRMIERGIFMLPTNLKRNHISLSHSEEDIDRTLEASEDAIRDMVR